MSATTVELYIRTLLILKQPKAAAKISKGPVKFLRTVGKQIVSYFHNTKPVTASMFSKRSIRIEAINAIYNLRHKIASWFR